MSLKIFATLPVDAFSYLVLGHVFVANMTGNVVFLAFVLASAPGFSILASLVALGAFVLGSRLGQHRGHLLSLAAALQALLLGIAVVLARWPTIPYHLVSVMLSSSCWASRWGFRTPLLASSLCPT